MNVKRFFGRTNKDALAKLRAELGPDAIILKNRAVEGGIEIIAMADEAHRDMGETDWPMARESSVETRTTEATLPARSDGGKPSAAGASSEVASREGAAGAATAVPEMTTVSFQQYVRDRLARKQVAGKATAAKPSSAKSAPAPQSVALDAPAAASAPKVKASPTAESKASPERSEGRTPIGRALTELPDLADSVATALPARGVGPGRLAEEDPASDGHEGAASGDSRRNTDTTSGRASASVAIPGGSRVQPVSAEAMADALDEARESITEAVQHSVLAELRQMKHFIAEQLDTMSWFEGTRRQPARSGLLRSLLHAGFSPALSRALVQRVPEDHDDEQAQAWAVQALVRNLNCDSEGAMIDGGGIFALIGPTGVGKTTSTAKMAARFALKHGTQSVGLVTVDAYRIGGQDQLRSFGRMLGVPVHVAHDAASLADFLHLYMNKKLVLIDTAGIGQRDERVEELLASLSSSVVRKLLVISAAAQTETQEEVIQAYRGAQAAGLIISKLDEAVRPGGALDCAIRHRLKVVGVADGQRVPEDWAWAESNALVERALDVRMAPAFELDDQLLGLMFSGGRGPAASLVARRSDV